MSGSSERGTVLVLVLIMLVLFFALGMAILASALTESRVAHNDEWFEGALYAAEAGLQTGIDQVNGNIDDSTQAIANSALSDSYGFRSGGRADGAPQPLQFQGSNTAAGYSISTGTGYNPSGYVFFQYQINATGTAPRNISREVEGLVEYGPVAN